MNDTIRNKIEEEGKTAENLSGNLSEKSFGTTSAAGSEARGVRINGKELTNGEMTGRELTGEKAPDKIKSRKREILETVLYLAAVVVLCLMFIRFVAYRCVVDGSSMEHYLTNNDSLIAERVTYYFRKPERFEVIIFKREGESRHNQPNGDSLIKRVIGLPGETVSISNGKVSINGEVLEADTYAMAGYTSAMDPVTLGEDEYFVLGDNRDISLDSRYIGPIKFSSIEGRAWVRIWPLKKAMVIKP